MSLSLKQISLFLSLFIISTWPCGADDQKRDDTIKVITDYAYRMGDKDSKEKSRALGLFGAKLKAVNLAAKYLTHKGVLEHYEKKQSEIFCLTTNEIKVSIIDEKFYQDINSYYFEIKSEVKSIDFIKAQIKDSELEKNESSFSYSEEMEQPVSKIINPGEELSRAYRYIRKEQWRISIIYLDHLEKKYSHWGDVFLAKAIAFYGMDDIDKMVDALKTACSLNNQEACNELLSFSSNSR
ncbi:MAG: hypothetical protein JSV31_21520 [Desulfobacterales bacterium]|nr:MAG: hypothetical protein JSV31_21520 [Desulfobacterales bacterium]